MREVTADYARVEEREVKKGHDLDVRTESLCCAHGYGLLHARLHLMITSVFSNVATRDTAQFKCIGVGTATLYNVRCIVIPLDVHTVIISCYI